MDQKIIITSGDVNRVLDNCETRNALGEIGIDITWCGYNVAIKRFISFTDMLSFVDGVVSGCFAKSDNRYLPEVRDLFFRCSLVEFYTNIVLPESVEEKNQIVYGTDIIDLILQNIDRGQFRAIMDGIEKRVTYLVNTDMKRIEDDPNNKDLIERRDDLLASQRDSILAAKQEKEAMIDLAMNGIQVELDAIRELIDAYTESLDSAKDLYDYQKRIAEKTANISALEKQLAAYQNDMSEETRSKIQKIQLELKDAKDDLKDTEYDRFVSDAKDALDSMYIGHVDDSLKNIQRTFSFDNKSIDDAFKEVSEEIECLITADCFVGEDGSIVREVNAYDLKAHCLGCGKRGDFTDTCDSCGGTNIKPGYGNDTSIFVSTENLADNIKYSTDNGSVKNCFKLEAGDDLMTAAVVSCNPNGSAYIWHITDDVKEDMSDGLVKKLNDYDQLYAYYHGEHTVTISDALLNSYNDKTWSGIIQVTNTSNEEDTATSARLSCKVNDDYAGYVKQKILKTMKRSTDDATSIDAMFKLSDEKFAPELRKYCLSRLVVCRPCYTPGSCV